VTTQLRARPIRRLRHLLLSSLLFSLPTSLLSHNSIAAEQPNAEAPKVAPSVSSPLPNNTTGSAAPESGATTKAEITPLEQTIETFITSEEIDTDKAVDFPTNI
jgi:hypothetical protein